MPEVDKSERRIRFLAQRLAVCMAELVARDMEYGDFCFDEWYQERLARGDNDRYYQVCLDFVRRMVERNDEAERNNVTAEDP